MKDYRSYETPLNSRYASEEMKYLFSSQYIIAFKLIPCKILECTDGVKACLAHTGT